MGDKRVVRIKKQTPRSEQADRSIGLWVDADVFAKIKSGNGDGLKKETFSASQHYLDLAALVLDDKSKKDGKKKSRSKSADPTR